MTLRSRLSAAWRAFRQDDFPPVKRASHVPPYPLPQRPSSIKPEAEYAGEMRAASRPSMADECEAMRKEQNAVDMSPHPLPSAVDESKLTPDYSNLEVPAIIRKRRKKLESVKK